MSREKQQNWARSQRDVAHTKTEGGCINTGILGAALMDDEETRTCSPEPFVDVKQAAEFLKLAPRRILQLARQDKLPAYPIGDGLRRVWRFRLSDLANAMLHFRQRSHVPEEI